MIWILPSGGIFFALMHTQKEKAAFAMQPFSFSLCS